jgi:16S rRNA C967 or C1407 C5-methylase (RsmB/RsmF family)
VKAGGKLIYATCSLLPEENERQIEKFLEGHKEFQLLDCNEILSQRHPGKLSLRQPSVARLTKESLSGTQSADRQVLCPDQSAGGMSDWVPDKFSFAYGEEKTFRNDDKGSPYLSLTPLEHNTDGFFAAVMERVSSESASSS